MTKILVFSGSARKKSFNQRLAGLAAHLAREAGAEVTLLTAEDYLLPMYDGDLEEHSGLPAEVVRLQQIFDAHQGLVVCSPEYNSSIAPLLKNLIDWVSRARDGRKSLEAFHGKTALLLSASPGNLGGLRGLVHLRSILSSIGVLVVPDQLAISHAHKILPEADELTDSGQREKLEKIVTQFVATTSRLTAGTDD